MIRRRREKAPRPITFRDRRVLPSGWINRSRYRYAGTHWITFSIVARRSACGGRSSPAIVGDADITTMARSRRNGDVTDAPPMPNSIATARGNPWLWGFVVRMADNAALRNHRQGRKQTSRRMPIISSRGSNLPAATTRGIGANWRRLPIAHRQTAAGSGFNEVDCSSERQLYGHEC